MLAVQVQVGRGLINPNLYPYPYAPAVSTRMGLQTHAIPYVLEAMGSTQFWYTM